MWLCVLSLSGCTFSQFKETYWIIIIYMPKKYCLWNNFETLNCFGSYGPLLKWCVLKWIWKFCAVLSMKMTQILVTVCLQFHFVLLVQQVMWTWQHSSLAFLQFWNRDPIFLGKVYGLGHKSLYFSPHWRVEGRGHILTENFVVPYFHFDMDNA